MSLALTLAFSEILLVLQVGDELIDALLVGILAVLIM